MYFFAFSSILPRLFTKIRYLFTFSLTTYYKNNVFISCLCLITKDFILCIYLLRLYSCMYVSVWIHVYKYMLIMYLCTYMYVWYGGMFCNWIYSQLGCFSITFVLNSIIDIITYIWHQYFACYTIMGKKPCHNDNKKNLPNVEHFLKEPKSICW